MTECKSERNHNKINNKCWLCQKRAWVEDWTGYRLCLRCFWESMCWGGGNKWFYIKTAKINIK